MPNLWVFTPRPRSSATPSSMESRSALSISTPPAGTAPWKRPTRRAVRLGFRLVSGLEEAEGARIAAARAGIPFADVEDVWRRAGVYVKSLVRLAEADAYWPSMRLARRDALWAIKALRDNPLPLFAVADGSGRPVPETNDEAVRLKAMTLGHEVIQDYSHVGLTLRPHPVSFLRQQLSS